MDKVEYKTRAMSWPPDLVKDQYKVIIDIREMCWNNAEDCYGKEREQWLDEYNECKQQAKILEQVAQERGIEL